MPRGFRKRMLVSEGDLMQLWFEICQVRKQEKRQLFKQSFKELLKDAELVNLTVQKKGENHA